MNPPNPDGPDYVAIATLVTGVITLLFGRNIWGMFRDKNAPESEHFCRVAQEYMEMIEKLHEHAINHQSGTIEGGLNCKQSADLFGSMSKKVGLLRKRLENLLNDEELLSGLEVLHLRWKDAIFTDKGLMTNKSSKTAQSEIIKMDETKEKLISFLNMLLVRAKKRKLILKNL